MRNNIPYSALAVFYDKLISGYPYEKALNKISALVQGKGIDLGTGSGKFAIELSKKGCSVVGVDNSSEMLAKAKENAKTAGVKPIFVQSDIMKLEFTRVDFVTAMCDVLNYLSGYEDVKKLSKKVYEALNNGGCFIFDISSEYKLRSMADEQYFEDREDITYLWCNKMRGQKLEMNLAYFIPENEDRYLRRDEIHDMYVYQTTKLMDLLSSIGFEVKIYDERLTKVNENSKRIFFFCKKK